MTAPEIRILVRFKSKRRYAPSDFLKIEEKANEILRGKGTRVANVRVATGAFELDLFPQEEKVAERAIHILSVEFGKVVVRRRLESQPSDVRNVGEIVQEAHMFFNDERFWECHEALEGAWRNERGREKELLQGIILVATAFIHFQRNRVPTALSVLRRAQPLLRWPEQNYRKIDIGKLQSNVKQILESGEIRTFKL